MSAVAAASLLIGLWWFFPTRRPFKDAALVARQVVTHRPPIISYISPTAAQSVPNIPRATAATRQEALDYLERLIEARLPKVRGGDVPKIEFLRDEELSEADRTFATEARAAFAASGKRLVITRTPSVDGGINHHAVEPFDVAQLPREVRRFLRDSDIQQFQDRLAYASVEADALGITYQSAPSRH